MSNETLAADLASNVVAGPAVAGVGRGVTAHRIHRALNHIVLIGVPLQFYAAGLGVFGAATFVMHATLGNLMTAVALVSFLVSLGARRAGASGWHAFLLLLLLLLQPVLAFAPRASAPWLSAVHPVIGLAIGVVAWRIDRRLSQRAGAWRRLLRPFETRPAPR